MFCRNGSSPHHPCECICKTGHHPADVVNVIRCKCAEAIKVTHFEKAKNVCPATFTSKPCEWCRNQGKKHILVWRPHRRSWSMSRCVPCHRWSSSQCWELRAPSARKSIKRDYCWAELHLEGLFDIKIRSFTEAVIVLLASVLASDTATRAHDIVFAQVFGSQVKLPRTLNLSARHLRKISSHSMDVQYMFMKTAHWEISFDFRTVTSKEHGPQGHACSNPRHPNSVGQKCVSSANINYSDDIRSSLE